MTETTQSLSELGELRQTLAETLDKFDRIENELRLARQELESKMGPVQSLLERKEIRTTELSAGPQLSLINEAARRLGLGESQEDILKIFVEEAAGQLERAVLFLKENDRYEPWKALGFNGESIDSLGPDNTEHPIVRCAQQRRAIFHENVSYFPATDSRVSTVCIPLVFDDLVPAVLYGDGETISMDSMELLALLAVLTLKNNRLQQLAASPGSEAGQLEQASQEVETEAAMAAAFTTPAVDAFETETPPADGDEWSETAEGAAHVAETDEDVFRAPTGFDVETAELQTESQAPEAPAQEEFPATESWSDTAHDWTTSEETSFPVDPGTEEFADFAEASEEFVEQEPAREGFEFESEQRPDTETQSETIQNETAGQPAEELPADVPHQEFELSVEEPFSQPIPVEEIPSAVPPPQHPETGHESTTIQTEELEKHHNEAKRFARLLVSEIKLYNEDEVVQGREHADLYARLSRDVDRSREMYEKRVHPAVQAEQDYFHAELVRILARGDAELLGRDDPGVQIKSHAKE